MKTTNVKIQEVTTKEALRRFVDYPNVLYKDVESFVPAFFGDDMDDWNPKKNPAFSYCEAKCFLALRDGEVVGRIGAILSHKANETWNTKRMRFTQVDFIDDRLRSLDYDFRARLADFGYRYTWCRCTIDIDNSPNLALHNAV